MHSEDVNKVFKKSSFTQREALRILHQAERLVRDPYGIHYKKAVRAKDIGKVRGSRTRFVKVNLDKLLSTKEDRNRTHSGGSVPTHLTDDSFKEVLTFANWPFDRTHS